MGKSKILIVLFLFFLYGCGYTAGSLLPTHINTIYVEMFTNKTTEPNIEIEITNAIKDKFSLDGALEITNSKEDADSILTGEVLKYEKQPLSYTSDDEVAEYRLVLTVNLTYTDLVNDNLMWKEENFKADSEYFTTLAQQTFTSTNLDEQVLIKNAAKELAEEIVARTVEGW